jgi:hypothetical protein
MMINNDKELSKEDQPDNQDDNQALPDEHPGVAVQGFLKIFDPESGEVFAQGRV